LLFAPVGLSAPSKPDPEEAGEGYQELRPPVCQKRCGRPDLDVYRSPFEPLGYLLGPCAVESLPLGYNDV
jgi:hypothetical protein